MLAVLRIGPYRFFFYSGDCAEPPHVHVQGNSGTAKLWLSPVRLAGSSGLGSKDLNTIQSHVQDNAEDLRRSWNEYFGR